VDATQALDFTDDDETDDELSSPQHRRPVSVISTEVITEIFVIDFLFVTTVDTGSTKSYLSSIIWYQSVCGDKFMVCKRVCNEYSLKCPCIVVILL